MTKILRNQKSVFLEALIITLFIFGVGILLGVFIESGRESQISELFLASDINLLDVKIQTEVLNLKDINCNEAIKKNIEFGDKIYNDAKILERYEGASRIKNTLVQYHKKYDLLRTLLWLNSIKIKEKCGSGFHTLVYLYDYSPDELELKGKQAVFSNFLTDLKEEFGGSIILIPIAKNLDISSLDLLIKKYNINETSIILDEKIIVQNPSNFYEIENRIRNSEQQ